MYVDVFTRIHIDEGEKALLTCRRSAYETVYEWISILLPFSLSLSGNGLINIKTVRASTLEKYKTNFDEKTNKYVSE